MASRAGPKRVPAPALPPAAPAWYEAEGAAWVGIAGAGAQPDLIAPPEGLLPGATRATLGFFRALHEEAPEAVADLRATVLPAFLAAVGMAAPSPAYDIAVRDQILSAWGAHTEELLNNRVPSLYMAWWEAALAWAARRELLPPLTGPVFAGSSPWPHAVRNYIIGMMFAMAVGAEDCPLMSIGNVPGLTTADVTLKIETPAFLAVESREAILARVLAEANAQLDEQATKLRGIGFQQDPSTKTQDDRPYRWTVRHVVKGETFRAIAISAQLSPDGVAESRVRKAVCAVMDTIGIQSTL